MITEGVAKVWDFNHFIPLIRSFLIPHPKITNLSHFHPGKQVLISAGLGRLIYTVIFSNSNNSQNEAWIYPFRVKPWSHIEGTNNKELKSLCEPREYLKLILKCLLPALSSQYLGSSLKHPLSLARLAVFSLALCFGSCLLNTLTHFVSSRINIIKLPMVVVQMEPHMAVKPDTYMGPLDRSG